MDTCQQFLGTTAQIHCMTMYEITNITSLVFFMLTMGVIAYWLFVRKGK